MPSPTAHLVTCIAIQLHVGSPDHSLHAHEALLDVHVVHVQVTHYASDGWLLHKSSEDARKQLEQEKTEAEAAARFQAEMDRALKEKVCIVALDHSCHCNKHHMLLGAASKSVVLHWML
jgi:hypothetical protein